MSLQCDDLLIGNSIDVTLVGLQVADEYQSGATVTVTLRDSNNNAVSGASGLTMSYQSGTDGEYKGTIPNTVSLTESGRYQVEVTATISGVGVGFWDCWKVAKRRKCG